MRLSAPQSVCEMITDPSALTFFPTAMMVQGKSSVAAMNKTAITVKIFKENPLLVILFGEFV
jgi:hypothetical protein